MGELTLKSIKMPLLCCFLSGPFTNHVFDLLHIMFKWAGLCQNVVRKQNSCILILGQHNITFELL